MNETGSPNTAPQVHLYKRIKVEEVGSDYLLLITDSKGNKNGISVGFIIELINEIEELKTRVIELENKKIISTKKEVIELLTENGVINLTKPINLFGNKVNEKKIKVIGTIYNDGKELRTLLDEGWKSSQMK